MSQKVSLGIHELRQITFELNKLLEAIKSDLYTENVPNRTATEKEVKKILQKFSETDPFILVEQTKNGFRYENKRNREHNDSTHNPHGKDKGVDQNFIKGLKIAVESELQAFTDELHEKEMHGCAKGAGL